MEFSDFIVEYLTNYKIENNKKEPLFISYIPGETTLVHNANLWGAAYLAESSLLVSDPKKQKLYANICTKAADFSIKYQNNNGSWLYGNKKHHNFIDSFHTGYNIEALSIIKNSLKINKYDSQIDLGYKFYLDNFITEKGDVKYYNNNLYPIDMHSFAQAIILLSANHNKFLSEKVIKRSIDLMYIRKLKYFIYQKNQIYKNKVNYLRWTQAWAYYSFMRYLYNFKND